MLSANGLLRPEPCSFLWFAGRFQAPLRPDKNPLGSPSPKFGVKPGGVQVSPSRGRPARGGEEDPEDEWEQLFNRLVCLFARLNVLVYFASLASIELATRIEGSDIY